MLQILHAKIWSHYPQATKKYHNVGESEKYLHDEDKKDHDIQAKESVEDEEEPNGSNETDELAVSGLNEYAGHNIEEALMIFKSAD